MEVGAGSRTNEAGQKPVRIVCFGDSVMWGQGLLRNQTYAYHVYRKLNPVRLATTAGPLMYAHSGAVIGARKDVSGRLMGRFDRLVSFILGLRTVPPWFRQGLGNEISCPSPTVVDQVESFDDAPQTVDLVLINGGGNDIGAVWYMRPTTSLESLKAKIERYCYEDMKSLLERVAEKFPNACIVVPGYIQSLSHETQAAVLKTYFARQLMLLFVWRRKWALDRIFERNAFFKNETAAAFRRAVDAANETDLAKRKRSQLSNRARILFAEAYKYQPFNSANAGRPWVWGVDLRELRPEDPLRDFRQGACSRFNRWSPWYWASLGHPNTQGAEELSEAILERLADWAKVNRQTRFRDLVERIRQVDVLPPPLPQGGGVVAADTAGTDDIAPIAVDTKM